MHGFDLIADFVLSHLDAVALPKRAKLYRALAGLTANAQENRRLAVLADECDAIESHHEQLAFDYKQARKRRKKGKG